MGLPALWDTIRRHEEVVPIAQLAEDHHRRHGKPLRVAVDEADWRFNNLTPQQVFMIRDATNQQAFQGIEKAMFYRLCRLLTLNIQLIFVFDGPGRPWKRGKRGQGRINYEERRLFQELLRCFGVPYHEAPGEAEAECARMQILGMVDAVWSQDSDSLMFGCTLWFHDHRVVKEEGTKDFSKENTKKTAKYACVVRADDLREKHKLDREGFVLFAMLVGGDYDTKGLPQCGPGIALQAVKQGLGKGLCECRNQQECRLWRDELTLFLQTTARGRTIDVPSTFPDYDILKKYYKPKVTSDQDLLLTPRLNLENSRPVQEHQLLRLTSERFNIWGRLYMNWVGPVLLTRDLVSRDSSKPKEILHDIRFIKQRPKKTGEHPPVRMFERKLSFSPFGVSSLGRADFEGPQFGNWNGDDKILFDEGYRVECEMPEYWLRKTLPGDLFGPNQPTPKRSAKRKRATVDADEVTGASGDNSKSAPRRDIALNEFPTSPLKRPRLSAPKPTVSENPGKPNSPSLGKVQQISNVIELSDSGDEEPQAQTTFNLKQTSSLAMTKSSLGLGSSASSSRAVSSIARDRYEDRIVFDTTIEEDDDEDDEDLQYALRLSMQEDYDYSIPPRNKSKFDDIFTMRETGRSVQGLSVPAWSLDETESSDWFPDISRATTRQARGGLSTRNGSSLRGTHANAIKADSVETHSWHPSFKQASVSKSPVLPPRERRIIAAGSDASATVGDSLVEIRAARLRHFAAPSVPAVKDASSKVLSPAVTTSVNQNLSRKVPEGIECVDLTDD